MIWSSTVYAGRVILAGAVLSYLPNNWDRNIVQRTTVQGFVEEDFNEDWLRDYAKILDVENKIQEICLGREDEDYNCEIVNVKEYLERDAEGEVFLETESGMRYDVFGRVIPDED